MECHDLCASTSHPKGHSTRGFSAQEQIDQGQGRVVYAAPKLGTAEMIGTRCKVC